MTKTMTDDKKTIDAIYKVRARNNRLWIGLLEIAVKKSPRKAKALLKGIAENDAAITVLTRKLVK